MTEEQIANVHHLIQLLEAPMPKDIIFEMANWYDDTHPCGTSACALGLWVLQGNTRFQVNPISSLSCSSFGIKGNGYGASNGIEPYEVARESFGMDVAAFDMAFQGCAWQPDDESEEFYGPWLEEVTRDMVADELRDYLRREGVAE